MEIRMKGIAGLSKAPTVIIRDDVGKHMVELEILDQSGKQLVHTYLPNKEMKKLKKLYGGR